MKEKIAFIAVGQAAGNIGSLFERKGYTIIYLNTSQEDLDTLIEAKHKYHINGGEGCNKDRQKSKQLVIEDFDNIVSKIEEIILQAFVMVIFSAGGGTGAGAGPMLCDLLLDEGKKVGCITILPEENESIKANVNAYSCLAELEKIKELSSVFIIDNNKGDKFKLNEIFVQSFVRFLEIPQKDKSEKGNIDKAEVLEVLFTYGMAVVIADKTLNVDAIENSCCAPVESDKCIKYIAVSGSETIDMDNTKKMFGVPVDCFRAYNEGITVCVLAGLSFPFSRMNQIYENTQKYKETILHNMDITKQGLLREDVDFLSKDTGEVRATKKEKKSRRDVMMKYLQG